MPPHLAYLLTSSLLKTLSYVSLYNLVGPQPQICLDCLYLSTLGLKVYITQPALYYFFEIGSFLTELGGRLVANNLPVFPTPNPYLLLKGLGL